MKRVNIDEMIDEVKKLAESKPVIKDGVFNIDNANYVKAINDVLDILYDKK